MPNINLFSQIISKLDRSVFNKLVIEKQTDKHQKGNTSWTHLISMLFCQFAKSQSVRDISNGLRSATGNLNHLGILKAPSKSTVSYQNKNRDWTLFQDYYYELQNRLGQLAGFKQKKFRIKSKIFLLDSSTVSLCLSLFDWARYKTQKGAIKMHTLLDYDGNLPAYVNITNGKTADNKGAYDIPLLKGSVIVADRFYNDFSLLNVWDSKGVYFESGFALGQGKKVIYTCSNTEFANAHFDIRPLQHIIYETTEQLTKDLINKIEAFIK